MKEYDDSLETNRRKSNQSAKQSKRNINIYEKEQSDTKKINVKIKGRNFSLNKKIPSNNTKKKITKNIKIKNNIIPFNNNHNKKIFK